MAKDIAIKIKVTVAWWLKPYIWGVVTTSVLAGLEPDWDKVARMVRRSLRAKVL